VIEEEFDIGPKVSRKSLEPFIHLTLRGGECVGGFASRISVGVARRKGEGGSLRD
jgi:hypothetical protein